MVLVLDQDLGAEQLVQAGVAEQRRWAKMPQDATSRLEHVGERWRLPVMVRSTLAERSVSSAGGRKRRVDPRPEQRQPLDGLVAEQV